MPGASGVLASIGEAAKAARQEVEQLAETAATTASKVEGDLQRIRDSSGRVKSDVERIFKELTEATELDDVLAQLDDDRNEWNGILKDLINGVKDGALDLQDVLKEYGDSTVEIGEGAKTLRELFEGMDPRRFKQRAQELRSVLREETLGLDEISKRLGQIPIQTAENLQELIALFSQNKITLDEVLKRLTKARDQLGGDSVTGALAEELEEALRSGRRRGQL